ncbi:TPA: hypothetical protein ACHGA6_003206 [Escherichia coli]|uniref:hypothetical protein n=1 Tax=Escherichia coli TaxID=562 RepID=UPI00149610C3|nr:hypothetical protein [Escherichia coli]HAH8650944.1 hypothetical protein [Escherichia coli]
MLELKFYTLSYTHKKKLVFFYGLGVFSPAQPSPAQPSPAQPSPAQPSPANVAFYLQIVTYIVHQISSLSGINKHWQRLSLSNTQ